MSKLEDLTGLQFGDLTVIEFDGFHTQPSGKRRSCWKCICKCGKTVSVMSSNLKKGNSKSCGCLGRKNAILASTKHGDRHSRLYSTWTNIKSRCSDIENMKYGGRGIKMCDEWANDYLAFKEWALRNGYNDSLSIDRIDVNGNYSPENCRWADATLQANNRRNTLYVDFNGEIHTVSEWAKIIGVKYHTLYARIFRLSIPLEEALNNS